MGNTMSDKSYILAIDQGTTGSHALLFDKKGSVVSRAYQEVRQFYPHTSWVEQDPQELVQSSLAVAREALQKAGVPISYVKSVGITNQRETTVIWDRYTGKSVSNAITWQCRRTDFLCEELKKKD